MGLLTRTTNLLSWTPPVVGEPCHGLSLTADEGTWVKLVDFRDHLNVVFLFFESTSKDKTDAWLNEYSERMRQFESLETVVFGVNTARTDELRTYRNGLELNFHLLYDPLAIESRAMRCSSRVAPLCKTTAVVVGKDGRTLFSERGHVDAAKVITILESAEGRSADTSDSTEPSVVVEPKPKTARKKAAKASAPKPAPAPGPLPVQNIDSLKAEALIDEENGGYVLVDVRTWSEYEADHSPNAIHIPIDELPNRYGELKQNTRIICVCQAGGRSAAAAEFLTSVGATEIYNVEGGMSAWSGRRVTGGKLQS